MSKVVAIIQARLGSSRFPAKTLMRIYDKPMLEHIIERVRAARRLDGIVVATTVSADDDPIVALAERLQVGIFRGSENNVLERYHGAAVYCGADVIVRVTADDPFKDPDIIQQAIELQQGGSYDYCSNTLQHSYPEGLDIEVFTFAALHTAFTEARLDSEKEHVTPFIWKRPERFSLHNFSCEPDLSHLRWTVDYEKDLIFTREVFRRLYPSKKIFLLRDVLELIEQEPALCQINSGIRRNEGYLRSLEKEINQ
jgi:spore coat polysaccharide biosynthesis protein SpsF